METQYSTVPPPGGSAGQERSTHLVVGGPDHEDYADPKSLKSAFSGVGKVKWGAYEVLLVPTVHTSIHR